jgi:hypothetical protein
MCICIGVFGFIGGWTYAASFAIFALEYYQASALIGLAKKGYPKATFDKFRTKVKIIKFVIISELFVSWLLLNVFFI